MGSQIPLSHFRKRARSLLDRARTRSSSNFRFAFSFLRPHQQRALKEVYRFCRVVDDIVDEPSEGQDPLDALDHWREQIERLFAGNWQQPDTEPLIASLGESYAIYPFEKEAFLGIIDGCEMDLQQCHYESIQELEQYCYRVASCVGLLCIAIFEETSPAAKRYARELGLALQYTNILRDVAEDAARGRIYLPRELLQACDLERSDIVENRYDARFLRLGQSLFDLAQSHYDAAHLALDEVPSPGRLYAAEVMGQTYHLILMELQAMKFDVFTRRPSLRRRDKVQAALSAAVHHTLPSMLRGVTRGRLR